MKQDYISHRKLPAQISTNINKSHIGQLDNNGFIIYTNDISENIQIYLKFVGNSKGC